MKDVRRRQKPASFKGKIFRILVCSAKYSGKIKICNPLLIRTTQVAYHSNLKGVLIKVTKSDGISIFTRHFLTVRDYFVYKIMNS